MNQTRRSLLSVIGVAPPVRHRHPPGGFSDSGRSGRPSSGSARSRRPCGRLSRSAASRPPAAASRSATPSRSGPESRAVTTTVRSPVFPQVTCGSSGPGPSRGRVRGVRLYVSTVDVALTGGSTPGVVSRPSISPRCPLRRPFCEPVAPFTGVRQRPRGPGARLHQFAAFRVVTRNSPNSIFELSLRHVLHAVQHPGNVVPGAALHRDPRRGDLPTLSVVRRLSRRRANPGPGCDG